MASLRLSPLDEPHGVVGPALRRRCPGRRPGTTPGCSSRPVTSASSRKRARLPGRRRAARAGSPSGRPRGAAPRRRATKTSPRPPRACGRRTRNRWPSLVESPSENPAVRSGSSPSLPRSRGYLRHLLARRVQGWPQARGSLIEASPRRSPGWRGRRPDSCHVAAVGLQMQRRHRLDDRPPCRREVPRATRWSARVFDLSRVQAWKAATSWAWLISPFCRASKSEE